MGRLHHFGKRLEDLFLGMEYVAQLIDQQFLNELDVPRLGTFGVNGRLSVRVSLTSWNAGASTNCHCSPSFQGPRASISPSSP